ncbi:MAG: tetratricopeptide repeat protein [Deltaproteobacteria bacterium]|nr:MAG: tetratricopeptide repeat protein [Deltaproteobacteria bacterium]
MRPLTPTRSALAVAVAAIVALASAPGHAADDLPVGGWRTLEIGVLPISYFGRAGEDLFADSPDVREAQAVAGRWHRLIEDRLAALDQVRLSRTTQIQERISRTQDYRRTVAVAAERFDLGVLRYHEIQPAEALRNLDKARELYQSVYADVAHPHELSDVAFYQGLILAEQQETTKAHMALRDLLTLDPTRRFERGYYPAAIEQALMGAQADVAMHTDVLAGGFTPDRLEGLAKLLGVDVFVIAMIDGSPDALALRLTLYDRRVHGFATSEHISLTDEALARDELDRALTSWHACAIEADRSGMFQRPRRKELFLDIGYTHDVWLKHTRTRDPLQSLGATLTLTWEPTPVLSLFARATQSDTLVDGNGDLLDDFVRTRLTLGAGLAFGPRDVRIFVRMGVDLGLALSAIGMTTDVDCKFFGTANDRCTSSFEAAAPAIWLGIDFSFGTRVQLVDGWYLAVSAGVVSYLFDPEVSGALNFPLHATVGFGAPF